MQFGEAAPGPSTSHSNVQTTAFSKTIGSVQRGQPLVAEISRKPALA